MERIWYVSCEFGDLKLGMESSHTNYEVMSTSGVRSKDSWFTPKRRLASLLKYCTTSSQTDNIITLSSMNCNIQLAGMVKKYHVG